MRRTIVMAIVLFGLISCTMPNAPESTGQQRSDLGPEGRWAIRLEGRPVMILTLHRDERAIGGWSGTRTVTQLKMSQDHLFSNVVGPAGTQPIVWARSTGPASLEYRVGRDADTETFRLVGNGTALLGTKGIPVRPRVAHRAAADESVPGDWDPAKVYHGEDDYRD